MMKLLYLSFYMVVIVVVLQQCVESTLVLRFDKTPPARSRSSTANFHYSVLSTNGSYACEKQHQNCSIHCEVVNFLYFCLLISISLSSRNFLLIGNFSQLDGQALRSCPLGSIILKNLTVNHNHRFLINMTTPNGETRSASYKWFIGKSQSIQQLYLLFYQVNVINFMHGLGCRYNSTHCLHYY